MGRGRIRTDTGTGFAANYLDTREVHMRSYLKEQVDKIMAYLFKVERRTLLWTNSSPTAVFSAQTISLDLSDYNEVEIEWLHNTGEQRSRLFNKGEVGASGLLFTVRTDSFAVQLRQFSSSASGITFTGGYVGTNAASYDNHCIPYKIYGIKLGGGTA